MASDYYILRLGVNALRDLKAIAVADPRFRERIARGQRRSLSDVPNRDAARARMPDVRISNDGSQAIWKQQAGTRTFVRGATKFTHAAIRAHLAANPSAWSVGDQP